jgi:hypothetical protein
MGFGEGRHSQAEDGEVVEKDPTGRYLRVWIILGFEFIIFFFSYKIKFK